MTEGNSSKKKWLWIAIAIAIAIAVIIILYMIFSRLSALQQQVDKTNTGESTTELESKINKVKDDYDKRLTDLEEKQRVQDELNKKYDTLLDRLVQNDNSAGDRLTKLQESIDSLSKQMKPSVPVERG